MIGFEQAAKDLNDRLALGHTLTVFVHAIDPNVVGLAGVKQSAQDVVALDLSLHFPIPIDDLCIDDESISGTFSFNRRRTLVIVPWHAVLQVDDQHEMPSGIPTRPPQPATAKVKAKRQLPAGWQVIEGGLSTEGAA